MRRFTLLLNLVIILLTISSITTVGDSLAISQDSRENQSTQTFEENLASNNAKIMSTVAEDDNGPIITEFDNNINITYENMENNPGQNVTFSTTGYYSYLNGTVESWILYDPAGNAIFNTSEIGIHWPMDINYNGTSNETIATWENQNLALSWDISNTSSQYFINVTFELPTYPALLGLWRYHLVINNTYYNHLIFDVNFQVVDDIKYDKVDTYALRGINNSIAMYEQESELDELSLGDNITIHSQFAFNTTNEKINTSLTPISGIVQIKDGESDDIIYDNIGFLRPYDINGTDIAHANITAGTEIDTVLNFVIPIDKELYGDYVLILKLNFDNETASFANWKFNTTIDLMNVSIKYRVLMNEFVSFDNKDNFSLSEIASGSVLFSATHWNLSLLEAYPNNNITLEIPIPVRELLINTHAIRVSDSEIISEMFSLEFISDNLAYWDAVILQSYALEDYELSFQWQTAIDDNDDGGYIRKYSDIPLENEFIWTFSLYVEFGVTYQSEDIYVNYDATTAQIRFRLSITATNQTLYNERAIVVTQGIQELDYTYNAFTGEYIVEIAVSTGGSGTLTVELNDGSGFSLSPDTVNYNIIFKDQNEIDEPQPSKQEKTFDYEDYLILFGLLGISVITLGIVVLLFRKL